MSDSQGNMSTKTVLVTGATSGIGKETARALAAQGAHVVVHGRDRQKTEAVAQQFRQELAGARVDYLLADLSAMDEVRRLAEEYKARFDRLDVLVNNAGAFFWNRRVTVDGLEMTFALDHLSYLLLTLLLLDTLKASAPSRVVNVSSAAHEQARPDLEDLQMERKYSGWQAYACAKLYNLYFTYELARRLDDSGVTVNALHPGFVATNLGTGNFGFLGRMIKPLINLRGKSAEEGARTSIYLASSPEVAGVTGKYFVDEQPVPSSDISYDRDIAQRLWQISEDLVEALPAR